MDKLPSIVKSILENALCDIAETCSLTGTQRRIVHLTGLRIEYLFEEAFRSDKDSRAKETKNDAAALGQSMASVENESDDEEDSLPYTDYTPCYSFKLHCYESDLDLTFTATLEALKVTVSGMVPSLFTNGIPFSEHLLDFDLTHEVQIDDSTPDTLECILAKINWDNVEIEVLAPKANDDMEQEVPKVMTRAGSLGDLGENPPPFAGLPKVLSPAFGASDLMPGTSIGAEALKNAFPEGVPDLIKLFEGGMPGDGFSSSPHQDTLTNLYGSLLGNKDSINPENSQGISLDNDTGKNQEANSSRDITNNGLAKGDFAKRKFDSEAHFKSENAVSVNKALKSAKDHVHEPNNELACIAFEALLNAISQLDYIATEAEAVKRIYQELKSEEHAPGDGYRHTINIWFNEVRDDLDICALTISVIPDELQVCTLLSGNHTGKGLSTLKLIHLTTKGSDSGSFIHNDAQHYITVALNEALGNGVISAEIPMPARNSHFFAELFPKA